MNRYRNSQAKVWEFFYAVLLPLSLMYFLYNILITIVGLFLGIIAVFNKKIKLFIDGRKTVFNQIEQRISNSDRTIWIHCASLGEFEQGRPIIEKLRTAYSNHKIVLTFFSPSGFEVQKNYKGADVVCYLPLDTSQNAKKFIDLVNPELAIFVKYEFWPNLLRELKRRNAETILVSGIFRKDQAFFKSYGSWMRKSLQIFSHFFVQDQQSKELLELIDLNNVSVSGDTRFDRVSQINEQDNSLDFIAQFKSDSLLLVAGSTWKEGEDLLIGYINQNKLKNVKVVFAPHNIKNKQVHQLKEGLKVDTVLYSEKEQSNLKGAKVFIADTIGILTKIYSYADIAYVGGGFATGLHNVLEPSTFGVPVIIGPQFDKFKEARELVNENGCLVVSNIDEMKTQLDSLFTDDNYRKQTGTICADYVIRNTGATKMVLEYVESKLKK